MARRAALCLLAGLWLAAAWAAAPPLVRIVAPRPEEEAFGVLDVEAEVESAEPVERVEFYLNGRRAGVVARPPYRLAIDSGRGAEDRELEVVAHTRSGARGSARLVLKAMRVDFEVRLELRQLYVTVTAREARVLDLERGDFRVLDNGQPQELVTFERGGVPITAVLLFDSSTSMSGGGLEAAQRGVRAFAASMAPLDQAMLLLFSDRLLHRSPFTDDGQVLAAGLAGVRARGGTAVNDHLFLALQLLAANQGRRVAILLSDGVDVESVLGMDEVRQSAAESRALLYWIRLAASGPEVTGRSSAWRETAEHAHEIIGLRQVVTASGGRVLEIPRIDDVDVALREILTELREQYVLGYYPSAVQGPGTWHEVEVRVARPGARVRSREGYREGRN